MLAIDDDPDFELITLIIGSHLLQESGLSHQLVEADFPKATKLWTIVSGNSLSTMADSVSLTLSKVSQFLSLIEVDMVVIHGDRFDAYAAASAAALMQIFTVHLEGGEVSGTIDGTLRHAITKLSHLHFTCTEHARQRVIAMGEGAAQTYFCGCPSYDEHLRNASLITDERSQEVLASLQLKKQEFLIVMHHPNTSSRTQTLKEYNCILDAVAEIGMQCVLFYPNLDPGNKDMIKMLHSKREVSDFFKFRVKFTTNLPMSSFSVLLMNCAVIVGNSSAIVRETCLFGTPAVNVGYRQKGRFMPSNVVYSPGENVSDLVALIKEQISAKYSPDMAYGSGKAVLKMMEVLRNVDFANTAK